MIQVLKKNKKFPQTIERGFDLQHGYRVYCWLLDNYGEETCFFLVPFSGTGDIYYDCQMIEGFCREKHIKKHLLITSSRACMEVTQLFPQVNALCVKSDELGHLIQFNCYMHCLSHIHFLHYDGPTFRMGLFNQMRGINGLNFFDYIQTLMFQNVKIEAKTLPAFCEKNDEFLNFQKQYGIREGKTVVLSPYAKSVPLLSVAFWEKLANELTAQGYRVLANRTEQEPDIPGTNQILIPYLQLKNILEYGGFFVGIRSGLTDILETIDCKKIVLYPQFFPKGQGSTLECYSFRHIGAGDFVEYTYDDSRHGMLLRANNEKLRECDLALIKLILQQISGCGGRI